MADIRQLLISKLYPPGSSEKLIVHLKIYQDIQTSGNNSDSKGTLRYLCITQKKNNVRISKVKKNGNGSFSVNKTWSLDDIKQMEIIDSHQFSITLNKVYLWAVERAKDKMIFLAFLIDFCRRLANHMPKLINIDEGNIIRYLADPSAPSGGSTNVKALNDTDSDGFISRTPSPRESNFPPSPTTSSGYSYRHQSMSARSISSQSESYNPLDASPNLLKHQRSASSRILSQVSLEKSLPDVNYSKNNPYESGSSRYSSGSRYSNGSEDTRYSNTSLSNELKYKYDEDPEIERKKDGFQRKLNDIQKTQFDQTSTTSKILVSDEWKSSHNSKALELKPLTEYTIESANIQSIAKSEERIKSIVGYIDRSIQELDNMEQWLTQFTSDMNSNQNQLEKS